MRKIESLAIGRAASLSCVRESATSWSSSANTLAAFKQFYEPYKVKDHGAILESLRQPQDLWTAANIHVAVMMVNTAQLGGLPPPKTYVDLLESKYKGKVIIADPANSSTAYTILWGIEKMLGADGLKALAKNIKVTASAPTVSAGAIIPQ